MKIAVIKCGGSILDGLTPQFFSSIEQLMKQGYRFVFVHGGGPDITEMLEFKQIESKFHNGLRITTKESFKVVEEVLAGKTNRKIVQMLEENGLSAIGINGSDAKCLQAKCIDEEKLGLVGEVTSVNTEVIMAMLNIGVIPVITPIAINSAGVKLNVNADYAAAAVAKALQVEQCIFVTDVTGVKIQGSLATFLTVEEVDLFIKEGEITGGMIPKMDSAVAVLGEGINSVMIVSGKNAFFDGKHWIGTEIGRKGTLIK
jgi:acetylglutamate kinase